MIAKEYIVNFPNTADVEAIIHMVNLEMSTHKTISESCVTAAISKIISSDLREELLTAALAEKELYNNWNTLYDALISMEHYYRPVEHLDRDVMSECE